MYNLKEVTVTASVSKNYNKAEITMTAEIESQEDLDIIKAQCRENALDLLKTLPSAKEEPKPEVVKPQYTAPKANPAPNRVYQPRPQTQPAQQEVRMASEKQIAYLKSFGYTGNGSELTFQQADTLLKQYKGEL